MSAKPYAVLGSVMLAHVGEVDWSDAVWSDFISTLNENRGKIDRLVVWSEGGALSIQRRKDATRVVKDNNLQVVVISDSRLVRGTAIAIGWATDRIAGYTVARREEALQSIGLAGEELEQALDLLESLRADATG